MGTTSYVDWNRSACLCDSGLLGWAAATCVGADGQQHLVLVDQVLLGDERFTYDYTTPQAPHEQPGPLPREMLEDMADRAALELAQQVLGTPCKIRVAQPGQACEWHRTEVNR